MVTSTGERTLLETLQGLDEPTLRYVVAGLSDAEKLLLARQVADAEANPYFKYRGDPLSFVEHALGESTWSLQREVLQAIPQHRKVVVAASHSVGKSHLASRAVGSVALSWPADMVTVQTTATNYRQVKGILWPYISRMRAKYNLPGEVFTTSWRIGAEEVGQGFSARNTDEAAVSGFHAMGELFLVVDEGGGIHRTLGHAFNNVLTGNGHALVIGNFPTDDDDTWFNEIWNSPEWHHIRISAFDTPNFPRPYGKSLTKLADVEEWLRIAQEDPGHPGLVGAFEEVGVCTICSPLVGQHTIAKHLTDIDWVRSIAAEFGEDSGYYQTRVLALPASNIVSKTLPMSWLEAAIEQAKATGEVPAPVRLGIDVAADGGDEFVVAWAVGWRGSIRHRSAGKDNQNTMDVAGRALEQIHAAEQYHREHGITEKVRVKIDHNGLGRGVSDQLIKLGKEGVHGATIVPVNSAKRAHDTKRFKNQRSEMWWTMRGLLQPNPATDEPGLLDLDVKLGNRVLSQLNAPKYETSSTGQLVVQMKSEVKAETGHSPDQADAMLMAFYEPPARAQVTSAGWMATSANYWGAV